MADPTPASMRRLAFGALLIVDFLLVAVMLATDKNLQTDFGSQPAYYVHWWGLLALGVLDLLLGALLVAAEFPPVQGWLPGARRKYLHLGAVLWTILSVVAMLGIVETYSQVGFQSMSQFEQYLFGVSAYPGALSYIPWLYDLLVAASALTALVGIVAVLSVQTTPTGSS
jgi:hypothetical protein